MIREKFNKEDSQHYFLSGEWKKPIWDGIKGHIFASFSCWNQGYIEDDAIRSGLSMMSKLIERADIAPTIKAHFPGAKGEAIVKRLEETFPDEMRIPGNGLKPDHDQLKADVLSGRIKLDGLQLRGS